MTTTANKSFSCGALHLTLSEYKSEYQSENYLQFLVKLITNTKIFRLGLIGSLDNFYAKLIII